MNLKFALDNPSTKRVLINFLMLGLGVLAGFDKLPYMKEFGLIIGQIFINCFKLISMPIIFLSLMVTFVNYRSNGMMQKLWKNTLKYTLSTTIGAAFLSLILFLIIQPHTLVIPPKNQVNLPQNLPSSYTDYLSHLIPSNFFQPFIENQVLSVLILAVLFGAALRHIPNQEVRQNLSDVFRGLHAIFTVLTRWLLRFIPLAIFGFMTMSVESIQHKSSLLGLGEYFLVIVLANLIQGFIVLPAWLKLKGFAPFQMMKVMSPALTVAFFSKSSVGTLPLTMDTIEQRLNISPEISRFVLPLCTSVNMNGCAAFIFTTVIYMMQNAHMHLSAFTYLAWVFIASIAAIGNAGVPMGCYFLSLSLLVTLNVPIALMGIILPFYTLIDMLETALNVWSDCCVVRIVEQDLNEAL